jgi:hypothetical protein
MDAFVGYCFKIFEVKKNTVINFVLSLQYTYHEIQVCNCVTYSVLHRALYSTSE